MKLKFYLENSVFLIGLGVCLLSCFFGSSAVGEQTTWHGYVDSATYVRHGIGLSKARIAAQLEGHKRLGNLGNLQRISLNAIFRVSYDGVYELNDTDYGDKAGGPIMIENEGYKVGMGPALVPHGGGVINHATWAAISGITTNEFGFDVNANPNDGLVVLGGHLHKAGGGVTIGVPVRPCDEDPRGCIDDYLDFDKDELASPELFSDEWDWIREFYVDATLPIKNQFLNFRIGKQQVIWGRTDLFRVLDVINPVDYSRNNIYDELEDIRIPMWIFNAEYRFGPSFKMDDFNIQFIWNFDKFRPHNLGQAGTPNQILDAGSLFRAFKNLWDNGGTVSNFAMGKITTDFGPGQAGIREVHVPGWSWEDTQLGLKIEGVLRDFGWSLNWYNYRSQLPSLRAGHIPVTNPFTGEYNPGGADHLIAFDVYFPRINLFGGSIDYFSQLIDTVFRFEFAYTEGEEFPNNLRKRLFSESGVIRYVIGADKNIFIRPLNRGRAFLFSFQLFGQHLLDHEERSTALTGTAHPVTGSPYGKTGMPDWEDNWIATLLIKGWWLSDRLSGQVVGAHDYRAKATAIAPSVEWLITNHWKVVFGANFKVGRSFTSSRFLYDDVRTSNPYPPFTGDPTATSASLGLAGYEPLGRFRAGPIGMAQKEDELQLTIRYRF